MSDEIKPISSTQPQDGPNDPRPNDTPLYIPGVCATCDSKLEYAFKVDTDRTTRYNEFMCPKCGGIRIDRKGEPQ